MGNTWFISDTHFGDARLLSDKGTPGSHLRGDRFSSVEQMDEHLIAKWNGLVRPGDKVYHLGDVTCGPRVRSRETLARLTGQKRLVLGNHDLDYRRVLQPYFPKVRLNRPFAEHGFICSHMPMSRAQFGKFKLNLHGHIHDAPDPTGHHYNISVEKTGYRPVHLDEILSEMRWRGL